MKQLPELCRTGSNPCFLFVKPSAGLSNLNGGIIFAYVYIENEPCLCGMDNTPFNAANGAMFPVMMNEGIHSDDPTAPLLRTGAMFSDEIHVGIFIQDKFIRLDTIGEIKDVFSGEVCNTIKAFSFSFYHFNVIEGTEIDEVKMVPYLEWYYDQEPQLTDLEYELGDFPDVGFEINITHRFRPKYCKNIIKKVAQGYSSVIKNTRYESNVVVNSEDIRRGEIGLVVECTSFDGDLVTYYPKIKFPSYAADQLYPNITASKAVAFLAKTKIIKTPNKVRVVWDLLQDKPEWKNYPETDITLFGRERYNPGELPHVLQTYRVLSGKLDVTFDIPANAPEWNQLFIKNDFIFSKYFKTWPKSQIL